MTGHVAQDGLLVGFASAGEAAQAARALRSRGYRRLETFSSYCPPEVDAVLALPRSRLPRWVAVCGFAGAALGYLVQWWTNAVDYPIDVGGRPLHALPAFLLVSFEMGVLGGGFGAFLGLLLASRLGRLWQPVFQVPGFERTSWDRAWVLVESGDPRFRLEETERELAALDGALEVVPLGEAAP